MAFEGVFQNIDFSLPVRAQQLQQQQLMQSIGQGIAMGERAQERDLQRRQLEAKAQGDYKQRAQDALFNQGLAQGMTPEQASVYVMQQTAPPVYTTDEFGRTVSRPSGWGGVQVPNGANTLFPVNTPQGMSQVPLSPVSGHATQEDAYFANLQAQMGQAGDIPSAPVITPETAAMNSQIVQESAMAADPMAVPQMEKTGFEYPKQEMDIDETNLDVWEYAAKNKIDLKSKSAEYQSKYAADLLAKKLEKKLLSAESLPVLRQMAIDNRNTLDMPMADMLNLPAKFLASDQAQAMDLTRQGLLGLALPLVKELGTNPTDKDMEITLRRVVDLNSGKASRQEQIERKIKEIEKKHPEFKSGTQQKQGIDQSLFDFMTPEERALFQ